MIEKKLLVIDDTIFYEKEYKYFMLNPMGILWQELGKSIKTVSLSVPTKAISGDTKHYSLIDGDNIKILSRAYYESPVKFYLKFYSTFLRTFIPLFKAIKENEVIFLRMPHVASPFIVFIVWLLNKKMFVQIKGRWAESTNYETKYRFIKSISYKIASLYDSFHLSVAKKYPSLVMGKKELLQTNSNTYSEEITVSLLNDEDFYFRKDTMKNDKINLLFVGRLSPAKGLLNLLNVSKSLGNKYKINIAGDGPLMETLLEEVNKNNLNNIDLLGSIAHNGKLKKLYEASDIFILPSLTENFPKVICEAMATGLPVISTNVGAIPDKLTNLHNVLLFDPEDEERLKYCINMLVENTNLRRNIISNGYTFVKDKTLDCTVDQIYHFIKEQFPNKANK